MIQRFEQDGVSFRYPANWRLEREQAETGWTATLHGPGGAFLTVTCDSGMPTTEDMAQTALDALRTEYPNLEAEPAVETVAGRMAVGHDIDFISLDLCISCWTRSFYSDAGTVLVLAQTDELEQERAGPVLRVVLASLRVEED